MYAAADQAGYPASDVGVYLQPIVQGVGYHCEFTFFYDPDNCADADKVKDLSASATQAMMANGGFFSRPYGPNTWSIFNHDSASVKVLNKLKKIVDPNGIMNPGKICF